MLGKSFLGCVQMEVALQNVMAFRLDNKQTRQEVSTTGYIRVLLPQLLKPTCEHGLWLCRKKFCTNVWKRR